MTMFLLLKIRTSIDILKNEKCKVTFGLEYRIIKRFEKRIAYCPDYFFRQLGYM